MGPEIRRVWKTNFHEELKLMIVSACKYPCVAVDTEFPGFLWSTSRDAPEADRYLDMKQNVDALKVIQVGMTLFDQAGNFAPDGPTWEFNFSDFDETQDPHSPVSVGLLKKHGVDLEKNRREGIDSSEFGLLVRKYLLHSHHRLQLVFFHGLYDVGYLLKLLLGGGALPDDGVESFWAMSKHVLHTMYDVKYMAGQCMGPRGAEIGLQRLGKVLKVERQQGTQHQAGSDCLLTASVFLELKKAYSIPDGKFDGIFYGIDATCVQMIHSFESWHSDYYYYYLATTLAEASHYDVISVC